MPSRVRSRTGAGAGGDGAGLGAGEGAGLGAGEGAGLGSGGRAGPDDMIIDSSLPFLGVLGEGPAPAEPGLESPGIRPTIREDTQHLL